MNPSTASVPAPSGSSNPLGAPWAATAVELAAALGADAEMGLTTGEAARRLAADGPNELRQSSGPHPLAIFLSQFKSIVIWVLMAAALLSGVLGEMVDAIAIGAIVLLNALLGFYQEFQASRAVAALRKMTAPHARVVRDGRSVIISSGEVVRGDLLVLDAGDLVAADARLVNAASLRAGEAPLTGESQPVEKGAADLPSRELPLADRVNMVYLGTTIAAGQGRALVTATGMSTEVGHISALLEEPGDTATPLQHRLDRVGRSLLYASLGIVALVFLFGLLRGQAVGPLLLGAVSLAVAAIPEGLPAVVTIALAMGVARMVRRNVLIRRLPAVETLGCAQVICSDKTGTLTVGEMTVRALWLPGREITVSGEGYSPTGEFRENGAALPTTPDAALKLLLTAGAACNDSELGESEGRATVIGDPTEGALLVAAAKAGIERTRLEEEQPRIASLPFDSERKRMTVVRRDSGKARAFTKGAPDIILSLCDHWLSAEGSAAPLTSDDRRAIAAANEGLAGRALRVLAIAYRDLPAADPAQLTPEAVEQGLVFLGLAAMADPPRSEAREAVRAAESAGIRVVMITGDHPLTGAAIARELGILKPSHAVLSGVELQRLSDSELAERVMDTAVFARVTADDKLRIVRALKSRGLTVAMTGDGVNDAPALREAAIGVAMGITGTEVAKEAADMVVTDDNFASIVAAVEEGRGVYENIRKCLRYLLTGNAAEIMVMFFAVLVGWPMPLLPLQLLWINLATDGLPALALAADPVDPSVLKRPPRSPNQELADRPFLLSVLRTACLTAAVSLLSFAYGYLVVGDLSAARNYAFTTLVYSELLRSLGARSETQPVWRHSGIAVNVHLALIVAASIAFQLAIHHVPLLQRLFSIAPISAAECLALFALGCIPFLAGELRKAFHFRQETQP